MTTHLFSNTFCKLEILFKLQMLKNERKEGEKGGEHFEGQGDKCISSQARMQFVQSTTQVVQFSSGNKAFFFCKKNIFSFSAIPLELEHNTKYTVEGLRKITRGAFSRAFESTWTRLIYSTSKAILKCNHKYSRRGCWYTHSLNAYTRLPCLNNLHLLKSMTSSAIKNEISCKDPRFEREGGEKKKRKTHTNYSKWLQHCTLWQPGQSQLG